MSPSAIRAWSLAGVSALVVLVLDQLTKAAALASIEPDERRDFLLVLDLVRVRNTGVAFGVLSGGGWLVPALSLLAMLGILVWFALRPIRPMAWLPAGLVIGGALGNLTDRVRLGAVTDFLKLPGWPAFNIADVAITTGVILLVIVIETDARRNED